MIVSSVSPPPPNAYILDHDGGIHAELEFLLRSHGLLARCFRDGGQLLSSPIPTSPCCLILDYRMECGAECIEFHRRMVESGWVHPVIYLSDCAETHAVVAAIKNGADNYLTKPFDPDNLITAVLSALERSKEILGRLRRGQQAKRLVDSLTRREREVVKLVGRGLLNKEIADKLNLSLVTVKLYRGCAMKKLGAGNAAQLVQIASLGGIKLDAKIPNDRSDRHM